MYIIINSTTMAGWSLASFFLTITTNYANILEATFPKFHTLAILALAFSTLFAFTTFSTFLFCAVTFNLAFTVLT